ncbi:MAG: FxsA family protein [Acidimicrobiia bacterium]|nr:FxsA family protein [Acidimicrobiia bacterium]
MRMRTWLFLVFLVVPIIEIVLFVVVGGWIGVWPTIGLIVFTAVVGSMLVSRQGRGTWIQLQREIAEGQSPSVTLVHGALILVAGALLLTPGFLTDTIGFTLLVPAAREGLRGWFVRRMNSRWVVIS